MGEPARVCDQETGSFVVRMHTESKRKRSKRKTRRRRPHQKKKMARSGGQIALGQSTEKKI